MRELHSLPAGKESGHNKACFSVQASPDPNFVQQLFALSTKISFKSQIFKLYVGNNDIVGNMDLHNLLFHQAFKSYIFEKKPRTYKCCKSNKNQVRQIFK